MEVNTMLRYYLNTGVEVFTGQQATGTSISINKALDLIRKYPLHTATLLH